MRDNFIFYRSFFEGVNAMPEESQLRLYKAIMEFALDGVELELEGIEKGIFALIRPQLEANNKRYTNGQKGGRPASNNESNTKAKTKGTASEKPKVIRKDKPQVNDKENHRLLDDKTIGYETVKPNKNVNDNVNVNEKGVIVRARENEGMKLFFEKHPQIQIDGYNGNVGEIDFKVLEERIAESSYLKQSTSFSWLCRQWQKISSGYYKDIKVDKSKKQDEPTCDIDFSEWQV